ILNIEKRHNVQILIIANPHMQTPQYSITRLKEDNVGKVKKPSYTLIQQPELLVERIEQVAPKFAEPAVKAFSSQQPVKAQNGFIKRLFSSLFSSGTPSEESTS